MFLEVKLSFYGIDRTDYKTSFVILNIFFIPYFDDIYNKILLTFLIIFLDLHRMPKVSFELMEDWKETLKNRLFYSFTVQAFNITIIN